MMFLSLFLFFRSAFLVPSHLLGMMGKEPQPSQFDIEDNFTSLGRLVFNWNYEFINKILSNEIAWLIKNSEKSLDEYGMVRTVNLSSRREELAFHSSSNGLFDPSEILLSFSKIKCREQSSDSKRMERILSSFKNVDDRDRLIFQFIRANTNIFLHYNIKYWGMLNGEIKKHFESLMMAKLDWPITMINEKIVVSEKIINARVNGISQTKKTPSSFISNTSFNFLKEVSADLKGEKSRYGSIWSISQQSGVPLDDLRSTRERFRSLFSINEHEEKKTIEKIENKLDFLRYFQVGVLTQARIESKNAILKSSTASESLDTIYQCGVLNERFPQYRNLAGPFTDSFYRKFLDDLTRELPELTKNEQIQSSKKNENLYVDGWASAGREVESDSELSTFNVLDKLFDEDKFNSFLANKEQLNFKRTQTETNFFDPEFPGNLESIYRDIPSSTESQKKTSSGKQPRVGEISDHKKIGKFKLCFPIHSFDPSFFEESLRAVEDIEIESCEMKAMPGVLYSFVMPQDSCYLSMVSKRLFSDDTPTKLVTIIKYSLEINSETLDPFEISERNLIIYGRFNEPLADRVKIFEDKKKTSRSSQFQEARTTNFRPENPKKKKLKNLKDTPWNPEFEDWNETPKKVKGEDEIDGQIRKAWLDMIRSATGQNFGVDSGAYPKHRPGFKSEANSKRNLAAKFVSAGNNPKISRSAPQLKRNFVNLDEKNLRSKLEESQKLSEEQATETGSQFLSKKSILDDAKSLSENQYRSVVADQILDRSDPASEDLRQIQAKNRKVGGDSKQSRDKKLPPVPKFDLTISQEDHSEKLLNNHLGVLDELKKRFQIPPPDPSLLKVPLNEASDHLRNLKRPNPPRESFEELINLHALFGKLYQAKISKGLQGLENSIYLLIGSTIAPPEESAKVSQEKPKMKHLDVASLTGTLESTFSKGPVEKPKRKFSPQITEGIRSDKTGDSSPYESYSQEEYKFVYPLLSREDPDLSSPSPKRQLHFYQTNLFTGFDANILELGVQCFGTLLSNRMARPLVPPRPHPPTSQRARENLRKFKNEARKKMIEANKSPFSF